jgi:hypothetical protein
MGPDSDIDLLVIKSGKKRLLDAMLLAVPR